MTVLCIFLYIIEFPQKPHKENNLRSGAHKCALHDLFVVKTNLKSPMKAMRLSLPLKCLWRKIDKTVPTPH